MTHIKINHLTRIEGHGNLEVQIKKGLSDARFSVVEAPRFFEALLREQNYREVTHIASRICGICAISHKCAALKATESAMDVRISEQTELLRRLASHGEVLSSHVLHIYFLAGPDYFDVPSIFPMLNTRRELVDRAVRLKELGYALCDVVAGRHPHPVAMTVGGFSFVHDTEALERLKGRLEDAMEDLKDTVRLFKTFHIPELERETEYVSLKHPEHYAFYEGKLCSSEKEVAPVYQYKEMIKESVVSHSTAKYARWHRSEYMVGALSRFNNNYDQLSDLAKEAAAELNLKAPCFNPFMITHAQIVECVHCTEDSLDLTNRLLENGIDRDEEQADYEICAGKGVGAVEAPRGTLFHEYEYDGQGKCISANLVIPTAQNLANLNADLKAYLPSLKEFDEQTLTRRLEMLIRAYDPCISCSTH